MNKDLKKAMNLLKQEIKYAKTSESDSLTGIIARIDELETVVKNSCLDSVSGSFPTEKEVNEAAESFGDLHTDYDAQFANGCEAGWKAGAEWMKQKYNDR